MLQSTTATGSLLLNNPTARKVVLKEDIKWDQFADGFPKLFINNVKDLAGRDGMYELKAMSNTKN